MSGRIAAGIVISFLLMGCLALAFSIQPVRASGTIYIRADGSLDPPDAPISTVDYITYTLTGNITSDAGGIVVERSNIIMDGNEYTLQGSGYEAGFSLSVSNVTIRNMNIKDFYYGISVSGSSDNTVSGNNITANNDYGIWLYSSSHDSISGNNITDNYDGVSLVDSSNSSMSGNNISANREHGVRLYNSSNNKIFGNNITGDRTSFGDGIDLYISNGNNVTGNTVTSMSGGIFLEYSGYNSVNGNVITNNHHGVILKISTGNVLRNNNMTGNSYNMGIYGIDDDLFNFGGVSLSSFLQDIDSSNTVNGNPVYYWVNQRMNRIPNDAGFVAAINCTEITVSNIKLTKNVQGILFAFTTNSVLQNLTATDNEVGVHLVCSDNNTITANNVTENNFGISLYYSSRNEFTQNIVTENEYFGVGLGIGLAGDSSTMFPLTTITSEGNLFRSNMISNNAYSWGGGLWLNNLGTRYTIIVDNNITGNGSGVHLRESSNNSIYHNNFVDNNPQVYIQASGYSNFWDNGVEGNYWNNYTGVDSDCNGIGDTSHVMDENNQDNYPLMGTFSSFNTSYGYAVDFVSNSSISDVDFNVSPGEVYPPESILTFNVSGDTDAEGFLRICIPKVLINGSYVIKFDDEIITNTTWPQVIELPCSNETHVYLYINYTHSEHTIIITGTTMIPEFPSFLILPIFFIATLLAVIVYKRKRVRSMWRIVPY